MKTKTIGAFEAKTRFSELLEKARQGTVFIVTRRGKPVARLGPSDVQACHPVFGSAKGRVRMAEDFEESLPELADYES
jgi:prevent-host-death family protein